MHFKINIWILISKKFTLGPGSFGFSLLCLPLLGAQPRPRPAPHHCAQLGECVSVCTLIKYTHRGSRRWGEKRVEIGLTQSSNMQHLLSSKFNFRSTAPKKTVSNFSNVGIPTTQSAGCNYNFHFQFSILQQANAIIVWLFNARHLLQINCAVLCRQILFYSVAHVLCALTPHWPLQNQRTRLFTISLLELEASNCGQHVACCTQFVRLTEVC